MSRIVAEFNSTPWAMLPSVLAAAHEVLDRWASGVRLSAEDISAVIGVAPAEAAARRERAATTGSVAVVPVLGIVSQRANMIHEVSSGAGTSTETLARQIKQHAADPAISAIVLDVDSPGGSVYGVEEVAAQIYEARAAKPVTAVINSLAASAGYWIASAAGQVVISPSGEAGSIGVYAAHIDRSAELERAGRKPTLISAGRYKVEGNPYEPLTDEARAAMQASVDGYYAQFVADVAKHRGTSAGAVRGGYGEGRVLRAEDAVSAGLADRIATLDQVIAELSGAKRGRSADSARRRLSLIAR